MKQHYLECPVRRDEKGCTCKTPISWNIDPIKSDGRETGEVQIWADVTEAQAKYIVLVTQAIPEDKPNE